MKLTFCVKISWMSLTNTHSPSFPLRNPHTWLSTPPHLWPLTPSPPSPPPPACHGSGCSMKRASSLGVLNVADKAAGDHYQERNNRLRMSRDLSASHTDLAHWRFLIGRCQGWGGVAWEVTGVTRIHFLSADVRSSSLCVKKLHNLPD